MVDIRHDLSEIPAARLRGGRAGVEAFARLEEQGRKLLAAGGAGRTALERSIAMRYLGQWRSLEVVVGSGEVDLRRGEIEQFHAEHERAPTAATTPVVLYRLQLEQIKHRRDRALTHERDGDAAPPDFRRAPRRSSGSTATASTDTPVYDARCCPRGSCSLGRR